MTLLAIAAAILPGVAAEPPPYWTRVDGCRHGHRAEVAIHGRRGLDLAPTQSPAAHARAARGGRAPTRLHGDPRRAPAHRAPSSAPAGVAHELRAPLADRVRAPARVGAGVGVLDGRVRVGQRSEQRDRQRLRRGVSIPAVDVVRRRRARMAEPSLVGVSSRRRRAADAARGCRALANLRTMKGHKIARRLVPELGTCEVCGAPAVDRHHRNGDHDDNRLENIAQVCRRCHHEIDGRVEAMRRDPKPCADCGTLAKPLTRERCRPCYLRLRRRLIAAGCHDRGGIGDARRDRRGRGVRPRGRLRARARVPRARGRRATCPPLLRRTGVDTDARPRRRRGGHRRAQTRARPPAAEPIPGQTSLDEVDAEGEA